MSYGKANFEEMSSPLYSEFGLNLALKKLNITVEELEAIVGRYSRGKHKGELRGYLRWFKILSAGWCRLGVSHGGFVFPITSGSFGYHLTDYDGNIFKNADGRPISEFGDGSGDRLMYAVHTRLELFYKNLEATKEAANVTLKESSAGHLTN